jgi:hypothetical protein
LHCHMYIDADVERIVYSECLDYYTDGTHLITTVDE